METRTLAQSMRALADEILSEAAAPLNKRVGCWELRVDEQWEIAMNGHNSPIQCSHGCEVPPFAVYVQFNGWPAGVIGPSGGWIAAGEVANEDAFIAAVRRRTNAATGGLTRCATSPAVQGGEG